MLAAAATAIGYGFIAVGIASPVRGDRAVLDLPPIGTAEAALLDDGRPVFVVNDAERGAWVIDAQGRQPSGTLAVLVAWCPTTRMFADPATGSAYTADGELRWGPAEGGLVVFATRSAADDPTRVVVGSDTTTQDRAPDTDGPPATTCSGSSWVVHRPALGEVFDPSVAVGEEPPGWIWVDGSLTTNTAGEAWLCDRVAGKCSTGAAVGGIDPATLAGGQGADGLFIGLVRDDAIVGLTFVPDLEEAP